VFRVYAVQEEAEAGGIKTLKKISNSLPKNAKFINIDQLEKNVHSPCYVSHKG
jgi:predicted secreted protein